MADETTDNIVLQHLRHIRGQLDRMGADMHELKKTQAAMLEILATHGSHQFRVDERLGRSEDPIRASIHRRNDA
jgi:hypothetical protein